MQQSRFRNCVLSVAVLCVSILNGRVLAAGEDELGELAARLQYNFYAADARALERAIQEIGKLEVDPALERARNYQLGYGQWKLAETIGAKDKSGARRALSACIDVTGKALDAVPKRANIPRPDLLHAELQAIQAGCHLARGDTSQATKLLEEGGSFQAGNPRILFVAASKAIAKAKSPADRASAERSMASAVSAFDQQPPQPPGTADWGHAEALAKLGEIQLLQGNTVAARNSLERALVLAPDYVFAKTLLAKGTGGR